MPPIASPRPFARTRTRAVANGSVPDDALVVASNRLPVRLERDPEGEWRTRPSDGGLRSALQTVLSERGGTWVGWSGACDLPLPRLRSLLGTGTEAYELEPVPMSAEERDGYYLGFSNRVLWPLFHGLPERVEHRPGDWETYKDVNARFAAALRSRGSGPIWVHDYHLVLVGAVLRSMGCRRPLGFFLHTPFPEPSVLESLPTGRDLVRALCRYDSVGFQTERDRQHFLDAAAALEPRARQDGGRGSGPRPLAERTHTFPVPIDAVYWSRRSTESHAARRAERIREELGAEVLLLGVDRLDYTKGLPQKLRGFARALELHPSLRGRVVLRQLGVPTREGIPTYDALRAEVEALVQEVNQRYGTTDWTPVDYVRGPWSRDELVAQYRAADVALVTPLSDGMNLVAKEYCAAKAVESGALVLSSSAGCAQHLDEGALLVDPRREDEVADAVFRAVVMTRAERHHRMAALRRAVRREDIEAWAREVLHTLRPVDTAAPPRQSIPTEVMAPPHRRVHDFILGLLSAGHGSW